MKGIILLVILSSFAWISGCSKSGSGPGTPPGGGGGSPFVPNCSGAATSFAADVNPIFQTVCAQSSCHNAGSVNGPGPLTDFTLISASKSSIRAAIISGAMPKTGTLTAAQKNSIICWIDAGGANN